MFYVIGNTRYVFNFIPDIQEIDALCLLKEIFNKIRFNYSILKKLG